MEQKFAYVLTELHLYRLNLTQMLEDGKNDPPEFEVIIDFKETNLPVGMGGFLLNSKLYLTGGENTLTPEEQAELDAELVAEPRKAEPPKVKPPKLEVEEEGASSDLSSDSFNNWPDEEEEEKSEGEETLPDKTEDEVKSKPYNKMVYMFDPYSSSCTPQPLMRPLHSSKTNPQVAVIDNKVYVYRDYPVLSNGPQPSPHHMECYHADDNFWEPIPTPPDTPGYDRVGLAYFSVLNRKIHIMGNSPDDSLYYDVDLREWFSADPQGFFRPYGPIFPFHGHSLLSQSPNGLVLSFTRKGLIAYLQAPDGSVKHHRRLIEINDLVMDGKPTYSMGFLKDLGVDDKFLYIYSTPGYKFIISTIRVAVQHQAPSGDPSVVANVLYGPHIISTDPSISDIKNVFIMSHDSTNHVDTDKSFLNQLLIA